MKRRRYYVTLAVLAVTVVVLGIRWSARAEQIETDTPSCCLLEEGVSWLPVEWLPEGLQEQVTDQTANRTIKGVRFIRIKQFVEAQGGSVGWDSGAGAVIVEFEGQTILLKALHSESFWQVQEQNGPGTAPPIVTTQIPARPCYSDGWEPPRLVDGVWVTSGISDEDAQRYAAEEKARLAREEVRTVREAQTVRPQWAWSGPSHWYGVPTATQWPGMMTTAAAMSMMSPGQRAGYLEEQQRQSAINRAVGSIMYDLRKMRR